VNFQLNLFKPSLSINDRQDDSRRLTQEKDMTKEGKAWLDEADIGSGEKKPSDKEIEREISKVKPSKPLKSDDAKADEKRKGLVDEDHPFPSKGN
jgi:hypothetical protein